MSDEPVFVDTNVFVYALDRKPSAKGEIAKKLLLQLIGGNRLRLSTQILQELFVVLTRKGQIPSTVSQALNHLEDLSALPLFLVDFPAIRAAGQLSDQAQISFWDALVLVSASRSGAKTLYTEDLNSGQRILDLEIINPFLAG